MATAIGPQPITLKKAVATAGTAVPLSTTTLIIGHAGAFLQAAKDNTNYIYIGDSAVDNTFAALSSAQTVPLPVGFDLSNLYIDADTSAEDVIVFYFK